jgi:hypothetical protein
MIKKVAQHFNYMKPKPLCRHTNSRPSAYRRAYTA